MPVSLPPSTGGVPVYRCTTTTATAHEVSGVTLGERPAPLAVSLPGRRRGDATGGNPDEIGLQGAEKPVHAKATTAEWQTGDERVQGVNVEGNSNRLLRERRRGMQSVSAQALSRKEREEAVPELKSTLQIVGYHEKGCAGGGIRWRRVTPPRRQNLTHMLGFPRTPDHDHAHLLRSAASLLCEPCPNTTTTPNLLLGASS